jgi:DHA1 family multidrug resistance protein-like MFS transporter
MVNWKRNLFFIWLSQILSLAAFGAVVPFIPLFLRDQMEISDTGIRGVWVAAFYFAGQVGFCLFTPLWGVLADRYGRKIMLLRANILSGLIMPLMAFSPGPFILVFLRFVVGVFSGTVNAAQTLVCSTTPEERHGFALGTLSSALWSGNMIGFVIGGYSISKFGFTWTFLICGAMLLAAAALVLFFVTEDFVPAPLPNRKTGTEYSPARGWRLPSYSVMVWGLLILFVFIGVARNFDNPFVAMLVEEVHGPSENAKWTAIISAVAAVAGIVSGMLLGYLSDRFSPGKIVIPAALGAAVTMIIQGTAGSLGLLGVGRFCNYFFAGGIDPVFQTMLSRATPPSKRGSVFGLSASARVGGSLISSVMGGYIIFHFGVRWIFYVGGLVFLALIPMFMLIIWLRKQHEKAETGFGRCRTSRVDDCPGNS